MQKTNRGGKIVLGSDGYESTRKHISKGLPMKSLKHWKKSFLLGKIGNGRNVRGFSHTLSSIFNLYTDLAVRASQSKGMPQAQ